MRGKKSIERLVWVILTLLWIGFIFSRSRQSADVSSEESASVLEFARRFVPFLSMRAVRKIAHFTEFLLLGVLLHFSFRSLQIRSSALLLGTGLLVAAADELLQLFSPGRSCQVTDVLLDFSGVVVSVLFFALLSRKNVRKTDAAESERQ